MMSNIRKFSLFAVLFVFALVSAQRSVTINDEVSFFKKGKTFFDNEQYVAAVDNLSKFLLEEAASPFDVRIAEAEYLIIYSNHYLQREGVEAEMLEYITDHEGTYFANRLSFELGGLYFLEESYKNAARSYAPCRVEWLNDEHLSEYYFKYAYSLFSLRKYEEAKPLFKETIEVGDKYYDEALYYYSFLQYREKNYHSALAGFEELMQHQKLKKSAQYYVAQIYFINGEYKKLLKFAPELIGENNNSRDIELSRIVGDAYYHIGDYDKAIMYLENYQETAKLISREDLYHLGVAYYMQKDLKKAAQSFAKITAKNDPLSQSAYSYLGECFVKMGDKQKARLAFETASKFKFNPEIREDAYYNYVKLSYETSVSPLKGSSSLLEGFLKEFPDSEYRLEIYDLMYKSYMTTNNYRDACQSIKKLKKKDKRLVLANQRVNYYYAVELYNQGRYAQAINHFKESLDGDPQEKTLKAKAMYWLGDAYYQMERYEEAMGEFNKFIKTPGAFGLEEFSLAHYNMGYSFFKLHNYNAAINWYRKFIQLDKSGDANLLTDAYNRVGDCFYLKRDFYSAIKYYAQSIGLGGKGVDYAYYQKGFCQGLSDQYEPKIVTLRMLLNNDPTSVYADNAQYEIGKTWAMLERYDEALEAYRDLYITYPKSKFASKAILNSGLVYYNRGDMASATESYKKVVDKYKGTDDAHAAMLALKDISVNENSVDEYIAFAKEVGSTSIQKREEDSLTFVAAEKLYMSQNYDGAIEAFDDYVKNFSNGLYVLTAYFYQADANMQIDNSPAAIKSLEYIVSQPRSDYTEQSLAVLSATYYNEKKYAKALETYKRLLENAEHKENIVAAKVGIVDCNYALNESGATILAVDDLLKENLSPAEVRKVNYFKAKSYMALDNKEAARDLFATLSDDISSDYGAEAKYTIAQMLYNEGKVEMAKKEVLDFVNKGTSRQYWLAKTFILLSDIYVGEEDLFQAKQYLLSISDNYVGEDDILGIVSAKLDVINEIEGQHIQQEIDSLDVHFVEPTNSIPTDSITE